MSAAELHDWYAYFLLHPYGPRVQRMQIADLAAITANVNRDPKKRSQAYQAEDFEIVGSVEAKRRQIDKVDAQLKLLGI